MFRHASAYPKTARATRVFLVMGCGVLASMAVQAPPRPHGVMSAAALAIGSAFGFLWILRDERRGAVAGFLVILVAAGFSWMVVWTTRPPRSWAQALYRRAHRSG